MTFLVWRLFLEQVVGTTGEIEKLDALLQIGLVGGLMLLNPALDTILFGAPLRSLVVKERRADSSVEFVKIHRVDSVL